MVTRKPTPRRHPEWTRIAPVLGLIAAGVAALTRPCYGLGLDEAQVAMHLGDLLSIDVPLSVDGRAADVEARIVAMRTSGAGELDLAAIARDFRANVVGDGRGGMQVHLSSRQRVLEPSLEFTVEVRAAGVRLQRDFVVFLDPPGLGDAPATMIASAPTQAPAPPPATVARPAPNIEPAPVVAPEPPAPPAAATVARHMPVRGAAPGADAEEAGVVFRREPPRTLAQAPREQPVLRPRAEQVAARNPSAVARIPDRPSDVYVVQPGDTLSGIAKAYADRYGLRTYDLVAALYRDNSGAFKGSANHLPAGARLSLAALDAHLGSVSIDVARSAADARRSPASGVSWSSLLPIATADAAPAPAAPPRFQLDMQLGAPRRPGKKGTVAR